MKKVHLLECIEPPNESDPDGYFEGVCHIGTDNMDDPQFTSYPSEVTCKHCLRRMERIEKGE